MRKKISVIGNYGYKENQIDGQTFRTRLVKEEVSKLLGENEVSWTDTSYIKANPFTTIKSIVINFKNSSNIIIMPGIRGLRLLLPLYLLLKRIYKCKVYYLVVGGWLARFLSKQQQYINMINRLDGLFVQTNRLMKELNKIGVEKTNLLPNFRKFKVDNNYKLSTSSPLKAVFFSRIIKEKGIELAVEAIKRINENSSSVIIELDIWGPIGKNYEDKFNELLRQNDFPFISYKGFLEPEKIYSVLPQYDIMIFPTYYQGEGFPGAVLDAFIAGIPVIASDWQDNSEIIVDMSTGLLFETNSISSLINVIEKVLHNPEVIVNMSRNCKNESQKYHVDNIIPKLLAIMNLCLKQEW